MESIDPASIYTDLVERSTAGLHQHRKLQYFGCCVEIPEFGTLALVRAAKSEQQYYTQAEKNQGQ